MVATVNLGGRHALERLHQRSGQSSPAKSVNDFRVKKERRSNDNKMQVQGYSVLKKQQHVVIVEDGEGMVSRVR